MRLLFVALVLVGSARAEEREPWKPPTALEYVPQAVAVGLISLDVWQTLNRHDRLANQPGWESNPLLGSRPSKAKIILVGGVLPVLLTTAIWYALPREIRWWVPGLIVPIEGVQVGINFSLGDRLW